MMNYQRMAVGNRRVVSVSLVFLSICVALGMLDSAAKAGTVLNAVRCKTLGVSRVISGRPHECVRVGDARQWQIVRAPSTTTSVVPGSLRADQVRPGIDLTGKNLRAIDLAGRDLSTVRATFADFTNANLSGAFVMSLNLASATLRGANLSGATGGWLYLNGANLEGANLTKAILRYSNFDAHVDNNTIRVNLRNAKLSEAILSGSTFENADLTGAVARNADFSSANFQQAILRNADFSNASFRSADLRGANLSGSTLANDWRSQFEGALFERTIWIDGTEWSTIPSKP